MTSTRFRFTHLLLVLKLAGAAAILIGAGAQLPDMYAQATRVPSIFDTPAGEATAAPAATATATLTATPDAPEADSEPQATRVPSVFDTPAGAASEEPATSPPQATSTPAASATSQGTAAPQATRVPSIFDTPTGSQSEPQPTSPPQATRVPSIFDTPAPAAPAESGATPQATRIPSIFDAPTEPPADQQQATRVPSIFDSPAETTPGDGGAASQQATPYQSIFGAAASDVIRFEGEEPPDAAYCLDCHASPYVQLVLPSEETISVTVDEEQYMESVHGQHGTDGYRCIRCHTGMNEYPHEEVSAATARELVIDYSTSCTRCHPAKYDETMDGVHFAALASGNQDAAVCADCHNGHAVERLTDDLTGDLLSGSSQISVDMCTDCHAEIYETYATSVHGSALLEGNADVPTCADCHGVHNVEGPSDASFRLFSPKTCAECHADEQLMAEYDISTNVFETYVGDFHGTTVTIFQETAPDQEFNAPVCVDCHGVHDIMQVDDANSPVIKANLVDTCQRCHPDASTEFPDSWLSHYEPTFDRTPSVALADTIYDLLIPTVIGGLGMFVVTDVFRRRMDRRKDR